MVSFNLHLALVLLALYQLLIIYLLKIKILPNQIAQSNKPLYNFLINKWYFDELYDVYLFNFQKN